jgi:glycosyl transferase family 2
VVITYGVCVGSWDRFQANVVPHILDREVITLYGQNSIAVAYNHILMAYASPMRTMPSALVLLHDDLEITDPEAEEKLMVAFQDPTVALVGVAGGGSAQGLAWWNVDPVGHQVTDSMEIDFGVRHGYVDSLEGSILAFSPWAIQYLRFDIGYPGFHGYDEISMLAKAKGKRSLVVDLDTYHHTKVGFDSVASQDEWLRADKRFREKWL